MSFNYSNSHTYSTESEKIEDSVATLLGGGKVDSETILSMVKTISSTPPYSGKISDEDILHITKRLETRFDIRMEIGNLLSADEYKPWVDDNRENIDWYYWRRYKRLLPDKKFSPNVISVLDIDTDKIIDHLENPKKEGSWKRKGLIVGHVQSGKTANYIGVICKAADAGYKVIIILAGLLNDLRNQTQERIDEGFVGLDSSLQLESRSLEDKLIGVGRFDDNVNRRAPVPLTTNTQDFDKNIATQLRAQISHFNEPIILVVKKNVSILKNLIDWLKINNADLSEFPMLLIDDEADHASVNTNKESEDPTATNERIRQLLKLFDQSSFIGYTATPFANIFIDPDTDDEMLQDDLFPRDFIISLDAPTNYVGSKRIYEEEGDLNIVREIDDFDHIIPLRHKKEDFPEQLPQSLKEAIRSFILIRAARIIRGQVNSHNSMLVNVSRFTGIQTTIKLLIHEYLTELRDAINNHYALPVRNALENSLIVELKNTYDTEFVSDGQSWNIIQKKLKRSVSPIKVIEVNGSKTSEPLDYNLRKFPNGRNVITVGGLSLSRGLTLEGLTVSYFLRNSIMYDTLMQMGRWFGYRNYYEDLCRIYMTETASSWYAHISKVTEELRDEFKRMEKAKMTPKDFGLCVRSHPDTLIVTARNKMRTGHSVIRQISLEGRLVETAVLFKDKEVIKSNLSLFGMLVENLDRTKCHTSYYPGYFYSSISVSYIKDFLNSFINHPASQLTDPKPIVEYTEWLAMNNVTNWDVLIVSLKKGTDSNLELNFDNLKIIPQQRRVAEYPGKGIELNKRRLASRGHEKAGILDTDIIEVEKLFRLSKPEAKNFPDRIYRSKRKRPLLMLHILDCRKKNNPEDPLFENGILAYGISFPGESGVGRPKKMVEYIVNTVWWNTNYSELLEEEEDID